MAKTNFEKKYRYLPVTVSLLLVLVLVIMTAQTGAQNKIKDRLAASGQKTSGRLEEALKSRLNPAPPAK